MSTPPWGEQPQDPQQPYQPYGGQQPYGQPPYAGYGGYGGPPPTSGLAIASLVVSIAGLVGCCGAPSFIGAILGHVARKQIRQRGESGDGLALAGIIVGWVAFAIFLVIAAVYGAAIVVAVSEDS